MTPDGKMPESDADALIELFEYLSKSVKHLQALSILNQGPVPEKTLKRALGADFWDQTEIDRLTTNGIVEIIDNDQAETTEQHIKLTPIGDLLLTVLTVGRDVATDFAQLKQFYSTVSSPSRSLPGLSALSGAEVYTNVSRQGHKTRTVDKQYNSFISNSEVLYEVAPFTTPVYPDYEEKLFETEFSPVIVQTPELVAHLNSDSESIATAKERIDKGGTEYRQYTGDAEASYILSLNNDSVSLISKNEKNTYVLCQTAADEAYEWAQRRFKEFKQNSVRLVVKDIRGEQMLAPQDEYKQYYYYDANDRLRSRAQRG